MVATTKVMVTRVRGEAMVIVSSLGDEGQPTEPIISWTDIWRRDNNIFWLIHSVFRAFLKKVSKAKQWSWIMGQFMDN